MRISIVAALCLFCLPGWTSANDVRAVVRGGNLFIYGDNDANSISITSMMPGSVRVTGNNNSLGQPTFVNDLGNGSVVLENWTGGIFAYLYGGDDDISVHDIDVQGPAHFDLGSGNDQFYGGQTFRAVVDLLAYKPLREFPTGHADFRSVLRVLGLDGNDYVELADVFIQGRTTLNLGAGNDHVTLGNGEVEGLAVEVNETLAIFPGSGDDLVSANGTSVLWDFLVDDTTGTLDLQIVNSKAGRDFLVYGASDANAVQFDGVTANRTIRVLGGSSADEFRVNATVPNLILNGGNGNDSFNLDQCTVGTLRCYLDGGDDALSALDCGFTDVYSYGGSGTDTFSFELCTASRVFIYGDGGIDSLNQAGNMFDSLRTWSVENK